MGKATGFLEYELRDRTYHPVEDRIKHFNEFVIPLNEKQLSLQGARCMDCGIPYCHTGCPVNNIIPDWNDLIFRGKYKEALEVLHSTNNFPEFTGRICPAPCQESCTLNIDDQPVTIKTIECAIIDKAWEQGWVKPEIIENKTGKKVVVVGSGPAGMAAAQQLARAGHDVTLFEKNAKIGGLLRYGIPDFKMEKHLIDRRHIQMEQEGVAICTNIEVGIDISKDQLDKDFDAIVLSGGAETPRDLPAPGRDYKGIHFAMDFLTQQNRRISGEELGNITEISAKDKHVVVIGGGDTGSDCVGTSFRQGATSVTQLEIMSKPPEKENKPVTWPDWPMKLRTSTSHDEGAEREFAITTKKFSGSNKSVDSLQTVRVDWKQDRDGLMEILEVEGSIEHLKADLVLLAMGFIHPTHEGILEELSVKLDKRGNVLANTEDYKTSVNKIFTAGDMRRGQSLVVWAIREGRQCAQAVDEFLMGSTDLPR
ncbi:MAG TPA: glutamate synthase subunit beta [Rhodospirillales bacterium]|jgi:glutamate synthase (NADPH/NADH) small chain|nr:glutamate synthase subunit beta [Rhodospirillales bacterium]HIL76453.1 glutamate synthase subunit beta [Rhodospirillales bacterium]